MAEAADRDRIARAYVTGYRDLYRVGLPALRAARARGLGPAWATSAVYLAYLVAFPDSHLLRKFGPGWRVGCGRWQPGSSPASTSRTSRWRR